MPNIIADGARGADGVAGFDFSTPAGSGNMANCNRLDDDCAQSGGTGGPGLPGGEGWPRGPGAHGGVIDIEVNSFSALITLSAKGGAGGNGGRGGNSDDCEWGRHGGNGGPGGAASIGGPSGNAGTIVVHTRNVADGNKPVITPDAGGSGRGSDPGVPGAGGAPGDDGTATGYFSASSECPDMGPVPGFGTIGGPAVPRSRGNGGNGMQGTAQFLQIV